MPSSGKQNWQCGADGHSKKLLLAYKICNSLSPLSHYPPKKSHGFLAQNVQRQDSEQQITSHIMKTFKRLVLAYISVQRLRWWPGWQFVQMIFIWLIGFHVPKALHPTGQISHHCQDCVLLMFHCLWQTQCDANWLPQSLKDHKHYHQWTAVLQATWGKWLTPGCPK